MGDNIKGLAALLFLAFIAWFAWQIFTGEPDRPISDAICTDLENGLTPIQIGLPGIRAGDRTAAETPDWFHGHVLLACPEQLDTNEGLRGYLEANGINPNTR